MSKNFFDDQEEPLTPMAAPIQPSSSSKILLGKNKIKRPTVMLIFLVIVSMLAVYFFIKIIKTPKNYDNNYEAAESSRIIENTFVDLEPFIVNLSPTDNKQNFLKTTITIHFATLLDTKSAESKLPLITDNLQTFLRELRVTDFNGTGSTLHLKEELIKRVNKVVYPIVVKEILFKELLVN